MPGTKQEEKQTRREPVEEKVLVCMPAGTLYSLSLPAEMLCGRCSSCQFTCPVHVLWPYFEKFGVGDMPFRDITPAQALAKLRYMLVKLEFEEAAAYRSHDLRRGRAKDIQRNGGTLYEILSAGEWRSPAFLDYLDLQELELDAVVEAHLAESSSEDEDVEGIAPL